MTRIIWALAAVSSLSKALEIPPPTGHFGVGVSKHVVEFENPDPFSPGNLSTSYLATVYYPTTTPGRTDCGGRPYLHPTTAAVFEEAWGFAPGNLSSLTSVHLLWGAPPAATAADRTLVFGPGGGGPPTEVYTALLSDLASRGYAVVGIDHPHEQPFAWYPSSSAPGPPGGSGVVGLDPSFAFTEELVGALYEARLRELLHFVTTGWPGLVRRESLPFRTDSLGIFGHSLGGALSLDAAARTGKSLVAAALNMDGFVFNASSDAARPVVLLGQELHTPENEATWGSYPAAQSGWWRTLLVRGAGHSDFSDVAVYKGLGPNTLSDFAVGPIDGVRAVEVTREFVAAFFDRWVRGRAGEGGILDEPGEEFGDVILEDGSDP